MSDPKAEVPPAGDRAPLPATPIEQAALLDVPAVFANRIFASVNVVTVRLTFAEQDAAGNVRGRVAVAIGVQDIEPLQKILARIAADVTLVIEPLPDTGERSNAAEN